MRTRTSSTSIARPEGERARRAPISRRRFLHESLWGGGAVLLAGCEGDEARDRGPACPDPLGGAVRESDASFVDDRAPVLNEPIGVGWDGRLYFDHSGLDVDTLVVDNEVFYVRTRYPDRLPDRDPWTIELGGLVERPGAAALADFEAEVADQGVHLLECSGNRGNGFGLISAARWGGVPLAAVLERARPLAGASHVLVSGNDDHSVPSAGGHSTPGASWIFPIETVLDAGAFLATTMNGEMLPDDHGRPVRLLVPGWYGCACIKWVESITFLDATSPPTSQMLEFAGRTHQDDPPPTLARDFRPARQELSAMPIRVERWRRGSAILHRVVGVVWGGVEPPESLELGFGGAEWHPVEMCPAPTSTRTWTLWRYDWQPPAAGDYALRLRGPTDAPQRRLDLGWYERTVRISAT